MLLFYTCANNLPSPMASRTPQNNPEANYHLGDGYDLSALPDDFRALKRELEKLEEQNKKLADRIESLEKARGSK
jgi:hypothetical protein